MPLTSLTKLSSLLLGLGLLACGRELKLNPQQVLAADDVAQAYQITVFATASGASSYLATATLKAPAIYGGSALFLPAGDTLTLNGTALSADAATGIYSATGSGNLPSYAFIWTHGAASFKNTLTANLYPPSTLPAAISKATPGSIPIAGVPGDVAVSGRVNAGPQVAPPFVALALAVGTTTQTAGDLSTLSAGPGVVTIQETTKAGLQMPTAAGGGTAVLVQYGYNVIITE